MSEVETGPMARVINVDDVAEVVLKNGSMWESHDKPLAPAGCHAGRLGVVLSRIPPGKSGCPFHTHQIEDEAFFVLSGRGVWRHGDEVREIGPGDCVSCPAGTSIGHQIGNPFDEDLRYLAIGMNDPNEVCTYPDSGQILVRSLQKNGFLRMADYFEGQPDPPRIMTLPRSGN